MKQLRSYLGLLAMAGFIFLGLWALLALVRFGSCASGGVYVSARQCAPGTGLKIMELMASIFGTLIATAVVANVRAVFACFALIGGMLSSYFFVVAFGANLSAAGESSTKTPALIAGIVCAVGALPFIWAATKKHSMDDPIQGGVSVQMPYSGAVTVLSPEQGGPAAIVRASVNGVPVSSNGGSAGVIPAFGPLSTAIAGATNVATQLAELDRLRAAGTLTPDEFQAAKARLLNQ